MKRNILIVFIFISGFNFAQTNNHVIEYYNKIVSFYNHYNDYITYTSKHYETTTKNVSSFQKNNSGTVFPHSCPYSFSINEKDLKVLEKNILSSPSNLENKDAILNQIKIAKASMTKNREICTKVSNYVDSKVYTDDTEMKKLYKYLDIFKTNNESIYNSLQEALSLASDQTFKIELENLKKSPFKSWIIPMKKDLRALDVVVSSLKKDDEEALKTKISTLKTSLQEHQKTANKPTSELTDIYYKSVYENFYRKLGYFLDYVGNKNSNLEYAGDKYNAVIKEYNKFIGQYN